MLLLHIENFLPFGKPPLIDNTKVTGIHLHPIAMNLIIFIPACIYSIPSPYEGHAKPIQLSFWGNLSFKDISELVHHSDKSIGFLDIVFFTIYDMGTYTIFAYKCSEVFCAYMELMIFV